MKEELELLKTEVANLKRRLNSAEGDKSLENKGFVKTYISENTPSTTDAGFRRDITLSLSGEAESQEFTVPAYPTKWRKLQDGSELYVPLYAFDSRY